MLTTLLLTGALVCPPTHVVLPEGATSMSFIDYKHLETAWKRCAEEHKPYTCVKKFEVRGGMKYRVTCARPEGFADATE